MVFWSMKPALRAFLGLLMGLILPHEGKWVWVQIGLFTPGVPEPADVLGQVPPKFSREGSGSARRAWV